MNCDAMWHNEMILLSTLFILLVRPAALHASTIVYKQTNNDNRYLAKKKWRKTDSNIDNKENQERKRKEEHNTLYYNYRWPWMREAS